MEVPGKEAGLLLGSVAEVVEMVRVEAGEFYLGNSEFLVICDELAGIDQFRGNGVEDFLEIGFLEDVGVEG